ncbi:MAG: BREX-2 system adenine-specific DNA-methyltransferase PglX [Polyangiaceae bacterium]|nr:BREX-2 system adenine-specific DNA-methyltransferase PglX [Polyangiaceae bacterium]
MAPRKKPSTVDLAPQSNPTAALDSALFLTKAQAVLTELEADLLSRARSSAGVRTSLRERHETERAARRTADPLEVWERHFVTQVAASWLLSCVFVRTLEDRGLLGHNRIAGPGAEDSQRLFFQIAPSLTEREYLLTVFRELSRLPAAEDLFDARHNPVWMLGPSAAMAKKLVALFRSPHAETPAFRFGQADTRFLGDLYQDLSSDVRERFALLQTPSFVERYILDRTLEPSIRRFGLDQTTLIDPTCGSGHFLLGAFERLLDHRQRTEPGLDVRHAAQKALDAVFGCDINPYAVAIARFRLTLAFLEKGGYTRLSLAPALPLHLVVADSLLHNPQHSQIKLGELSGQQLATWEGEAFALEDEQAARDVLHRKFTVVVGNPPYITVKDAYLRERYREMYPRSAAGKYSLGAPFTERFFQLAKQGGFVGMITANSFMKREFGKKLIEQFLPTVNLDGVVNTSGAYIPGHGTPTVILLGTHEPQQASDVLAVLAKRGEPSTPQDPEQGLVWRSIADHGEEVEFENDFISVARVPKTTLSKHPWSLGGGGAAELKELLEERAQCRLGDLVDSIGIASFTLEDDVYIRPRQVWDRTGASRPFTRPMVIGEAIRDWTVGEVETALFPYFPDFRLISPKDDALKVLWPHRTNLSNNKLFGGKTKVEGGLAWYEFGRLTAAKLRTPLTITFAFVATHNHFVLDRGGKVFNRSAPIIKLKEDATEDDHLALLAYLNSSTACFWMKQVCHNKTNASQKHTTDPARAAYEFAGTALESMPIPPQNASAMAMLARSLTEAATARSKWLSGGVLIDAPDAWKSADTLRETVNREWRRFDELTARCACIQEEIDWMIYVAYGLTDAPVSASVADGNWVCPLGDRPFEASTGYASGVSERVRTSSEQTRSVVGRVPDWWKGRDALALHSSLALLESRTNKRAWRDTEQNVDQAEFRGEVVRHWCEEYLASDLERVTQKRAEPVPFREILQAIREESQTLNTVSEYLNVEGRELAFGLIERESVPFLAAYRHTLSGLEKRAVWEKVWDLQRAEDRGEKVNPFDPPPKYDQGDYRDASTWRLRGKLDVPKERFISYPGCESDEDREPVFGWAGWNHQQQAQALATLYQHRRTGEAWSKERLLPMLAGLLELIPWVKQWHNDPNPEFGGLRLGDYYETFLDGECHALGLSRDDLRAFRPAEKSKAKRPTAKKKTKPEGEQSP